MRNERRRPKLGDVVEIDTPRGLSYALYTHFHDEFGFLLRVFEGFYSVRPDRLEVILGNREQFSAFTYLLEGIRSGSARIVENVSIPDRFRQFPLFKRGFPGSDRKVGDRWMLWDGETNTFVGKLSPEQADYPEQVLYSFEYFRVLIAEEWRSRYQE